jgi:hypothetical protein
MNSLRTEKGISKQFSNVNYFLYPLYYFIKIKTRKVFFTGLLKFSLLDLKTKKQINLGFIASKHSQIIIKELFINPNYKYTGF